MHYNFWAGFLEPASCSHWTHVPQSLHSLQQVRPHRQQPTKLLRPWDSPGKNTGVGCHFLLQCMKVKGESEVAQSCPTLSDPIDCSPPGSSIPGILQARTLEWVAISFSNAWKWKWSRSVVSDSSRSHGLQPTRLLCPWDFPGKSNGVGYHCLTFTCFFSLQIIDKLL